MWIFTDRGFLSIVAHTEMPDSLLVRARVAGDIEAIFPGAAVSVTPGADYRFRAVVPRSEAASLLASLIAGIDYPNFKDRIAEAQGMDRARLYSDLWFEMKRYQEEKADDDAENTC